MLVIVVVFSKIIVMFKNNKGEKMHKVEKNIIKVKKFLLKAIMQEFFQTMMKKKEW